MAVPNSRATFKSYILRKLGDGVIRINVSDLQVEDRIDEAISQYRDWHYMATTRTYAKHQITEEDKLNRYLPVDNTLIADIIRVLPITGMGSNASMFDIRYQIALNDLYTITQQSMLPFYMTMQHLQVLEDMLQALPPVDFNRYSDKVELVTNWDKINVGSWVVFEIDRFVDPDENTEMWGDRWLARYAAALVKKQWGTNLGKMTVALPGGVSFNGQQIYAQADEEIKDLERSLKDEYSLPFGFYQG